MNPDRQRATHVQPICNALLHGVAVPCGPHIADVHGWCVRYSEQAVRPILTQDRRARADLYLALMQADEVAALAVTTPDGYWHSMDMTVVQMAAFVSGLLFLASFFNKRDSDIYRTLATMCPEAWHGAMYQGDDPDRAYAPPKRAGLR